MDFLDPLSPLVSIVHCSRQIFQATSCIGTELQYVGSSWSSNLCTSMWRDPFTLIERLRINTVSQNILICLSNIERIGSFDSLLIGDFWNVLGCFAFWFFCFFLFSFQKATIGCLVGFNGISTLVVNPVHTFTLSNKQDLYAHSQIVSNIAICWTVARTTWLPVLTRYKRRCVS